MLLSDSKEKVDTSFCLLSPSEVVSIAYHSIFNYPLTQEELLKWSVGDFYLQKLNKSKVEKLAKKIKSERGYYFFDKKKNFIYQRILRHKLGEKKKLIAEKSARILSFVPTIRFVGLTGALAMNNGSEDSDIDILLITSKKTLWLTRLVAYLFLTVAGVKVRKYIKDPKSSDQKNRLCLNMWVEESDMVFRKRSIFTAHEICQMIPLVDKGNIYSLFVSKNSWVRKYWPNAMGGVKKMKEKEKKSLILGFIVSLCWSLEPLAYKFQRLYMKPKITREKVSPTRAIFHPYDWNGLVVGSLNKLFG